MKYITYTIPCYISEKFLHNAVDSLLAVKDDAEIIIVNDGSTDKTLEIANAYQKKHPKTIKVIDKENGGHGSGVNAGLKEATGLYYKVVDSDDWLDHENIVTFIETIKKHYQEATLPDLYVLDFIYEQVAKQENFVRSYEKNFPSNKIFTWNQTKKKFKYSNTMLMLAQVFKTSVLRRSGVELPEHTFYVDNIFSYTPLAFVEKIYYLPLVLYHYYIGRDDQSVQLHNIVDRYEQQIKVMNIMLHTYSYRDIKRMPKGLRKYMKHLLSAIMIITQMFTSAKDSKERRKDLKKLWRDLRKKDQALYWFLRYRSMNTLVNFLPWKLRGYLMLKGYLYLAKKVKLG